MQQSRASNTPGYRIKKQRGNYLSEDFMKDDEEGFKMSIHSSSNKSPKKSPGNKKKRNNSLAVNKNDYEKFSYRSKKSAQTKGNISSSSLSGSNKKFQQTGQIKQFANVKQLLMIKAYDRKLFRKVTGSNEANKNFLKLGDVRHDPFRKQTFKVMVENFKEITMRIRSGYDKVLSKILFQNTNTSAIITLASVQPLLEKVRQQADLMYFKVKQCLDTHDARQFRSLLLKFQTFLNASQQIEQIILIVTDSKHKIDNLFKNLEKDKHLDEKVNNERRKGIKKVRNAVKDYGNDGIEAKILDKVQSAINQMADKSLQAYSKLNGVRGLMMRIKQCMKNNKDFFELSDIVRMNQIFRQVLNEAHSYQRFVDKFMEEGDIINDDLRSCILRYKQQVEISKQSVYSMQIKFVSNIIETSIQSFEGNYSVCNAVESTMIEDYQKIQKLLSSICENLSDETAKLAIKSMNRDISHQLRAVQKQLKKIHRIPKSLLLDTPQGYETLMKVQQLVNEYKKNIQEIIERSERAHKQISKRRCKRQLIQKVDLEQSFINKAIQISKKLNEERRKNFISNCKAIKQINEKLTLSQLATELGDIKNFRQFKQIFDQFEQVSRSNEIKSVIQQLGIEQKFYETTPLFVDLYHQALCVTQHNLLKTIQSMEQIYKKKSVKIRMAENFVERAYAFTLVKGLDTQIMTKIDNKKNINFPQNQHDLQTLKRQIKYLKAVINLLPELLVKDKLESSYSVMKETLDGVIITEELKWNKNKQYYVDSNEMFKFIQEAFERIFELKEKVQTDVIMKIVQNLKLNLQKLEKKQIKTAFHHNRTQKVVSSIKKYMKINEDYIEGLKNVESAQRLQGYSEFVFITAKYLRQTQQSYYGVVNKGKNIFWIRQFENEKKYSEFGSIIGFHELAKGEKIQKCVEVSIEAKKRIEKPKQQVKKANEKNKKKQEKRSDISDDMAEQISELKQQSGIVSDDMGEQINEDNMEQQMFEEMSNEMGENIEEAEEVEDEMIDEASQEIIPDVDQNMIDDFEDKYESKKINSRPSAARSKQKSNSKSEIHKSSQKEQKNTFILSNSPNKREQTKSGKKQQENQKNTQIVIKDKKANFTYEVFKYIDTLEDIEQLVGKVKNFKNNFWKSIDFRSVEKYFNRDNSNDLDKVLLQQLQKYIKASFHQDFFTSIKINEDYKNILKQIDDLNLLKLSVLTLIFQRIHRKYSCLLGVNRELLRISVKIADKWRAQQCIQAYINKQLSSNSISFQQFDTKLYIQQLIVSSSNLETKYQIGDRSLHIRGSILKQQIEECKKIIKDYSDFSKFPDGLNLQQTLTKIWYNLVTQGEQVDIGIPQKLLSDNKTLSSSTDFTQVIHYIREIRDEGHKILNEMGRHQKQLRSILKNQGNLGCIQDLIRLYNFNDQFVISYEQTPVFCQETGKSQFNNPDSNLLKYLLVPGEKKQKKITSQFIRNKIKTKPDLYATFRHQISKFLSVLSIQSHIWPSHTALEIKVTKDQVIRLIVNSVSNGIIQDPKQLESLDPINCCIKITNHQPHVYEYIIDDTKTIMDQKCNQQYYKEFCKAKQSYKTYKKSKYDVGDSLFESLIGQQSEDNSVTSQIFDYVENLSLILKQKVYNFDHETIFNFHTHTKSQVEQLKVCIVEQVKLLLSIVEEPIDIDQKNPLASLSQLKSRNDSVLKWLNIYQKKEKKDLYQIKLSFSEDPNQKYTLYRGQNSKNIQIYLKRVAPNSKSIKQKSKNFIKEEKSQYKQSWCVQIGKFMKYLCSQLTQINSTQFHTFVCQYNLVHILLKQKKNKNLINLHREMASNIEEKVELVDMIRQILNSFKGNNSVERLLKMEIEQKCQRKIEQVTNYWIQQKAKFSEINVENTEYTKFGNWIAHFAGKLYKHPFYILLDKYNEQDVVCILAGQNQEDIKKNLNSLNLPGEFVVKENKNTFKKISLSDQIFKLKLDLKCISSEELQHFIEENFGIIEQNEQNENLVQTLMLGVYRKIKEKDDETQYLLDMIPIKQALLNKPHKIQMSINQYEVKCNIEVRILYVKYNRGSKISEDNIFMEKKSEKFTDIELNQIVIASGLSTWFKLELTKLIQRKQAEKKALLQKLQRQKQEKQALERQKKRLEQLQKERVRKALEEQEQRKRKQKEEGVNTANDGGIFVLPSDSVIIGQEEEEYLKNLYDQLAQKSIYQIPKGQLEGQSQKSIKNVSANIKSDKNIQIKRQTEKVIKQLQKNVEENKKDQFHEITQRYLNSLEEFIMARQEALGELLSKLKQTPHQGENKQNKLPKQLEGLLKQTEKISEGKIANSQFVKSYHSMSEQKKNILVCVHK